MRAGFLLSLALVWAPALAQTAAPAVPGAAASGSPAVSAPRTLSDVFAVPPGKRVPVQGLKSRPAQACMKNRKTVDEAVVACMTGEGPVPQ